MTHSFAIAVLPGDGIGPEVTSAAVDALKALENISDIRFTFAQALIGGCAYDATGEPLPKTTLTLAQNADAVLLGAVGGPQWDGLPRDKRPEQALLGLRAGLGVFANLRPVRVFEELTSASPLKPGIVAGADILVVRELTGGIYFGSPRGITLENGKRTGRNTLIYTEDEIARVAQVAFRAASSRRCSLVSVDKANVLECTQLWRDVVNETAKQYPDVTLSHLYVDNAAMQLVRDPKQFDVLLCDNMFGDILSDEAAMISGSIGLMASASLDANGKGLFEPIHGSAPDLKGKGVANPLAAILSTALMLTYSCQRPVEALCIENAVAAVLKQGLRTPDIFSPGTTLVGTVEMAKAVVTALSKA